MYNFNYTHIYSIFETNERLFWNTSYLHSLREYPKCLCLSYDIDEIPLGYWIDDKGWPIPKNRALILESIYEINLTKWDTFYV